MAEKEKKQTPQEIIEENISAIQFLKKLLLVIVIAVIVTVVSLALAITTNTTFFWLLFLIALICVGLVSWYCAKLTGREMVGLDKLGLNSMDGCLTSVIYVPIYYVMFMYYTLAGWVFVLMAISEMKKENKQLMTKIKK